MHRPFDVEMQKFHFWEFILQLIPALFKITRVQGYARQHCVKQQTNGDNTGCFPLLGTGYIARVTMLHKAWLWTHGGSIPCELKDV